MALTAVSNPSGIRHSTLANRGDEQARVDAIKQLQRLTTTVVVGAAAVTNIAIAGLAIDDQLQSVIMVAGGVPTIVADASITSAGNIQLATTVSTGNKLIVAYWDIA